MTKFIKRIVFVSLIAIFAMLALASCTKNDGALEYKAVKGGYEVVGLKDESVKDVIIPEKFNGKDIVSIGDNAFRGEYIESISVPATVKSFGLNAFELCTYLKKVEVADATSFAGASFENAYANPLNGGAELYCGGKVVTELALNCENVSDFAYTGCTSIESLKLSGVKSIGYGSFDGCSSLAKLDLGESVQSIGSFAFSKNAFEALVIPASVTSVGRSAFSQNEALVSVTLPASISALSDRMFFGCVSLKNINFDNLTSIGVGALYGCSALEVVEIPTGLTRIEEYAFYNCSGLISVEIPENSTLEFIGESAFCGCTALKSIYLDRAAELKTIGDHAFEYCVSLESLTLPSGMETLGEWAFASCSSLKLTEDDGVGYIGNDGNPYILLYKLLDDEKENVNVAIGTKFIHQGAFLNAKSIKKVDMAGGVRSIGAQAFAFCTSLTEISISGSVRTIGDGALMGCVALEKLKFKGTSDQWNNSKNEKYVKKGTNWKYNAGKYAISYG